MKKKRRRIFLLLSSFLLAISMMTAVSATSGVKISKKKASIFEGQALRLEITGTEEKPAWSSSNVKVVKVNKNGKLTGIRAGKATVTAKIGEKTRSCKVTVKSPSLSRTKISLKEGKTAKIKLKGTKIKSVSSSNKSVG